MHLELPSGMNELEIATRLAGVAAGEGSREDRPMFRSGPAHLDPDAIDGAADLVAHVSEESVPPLTFALREQSPGDQLEFVILVNRHDEVHRDRVIPIQARRLHRDTRHFDYVRPRRQNSEDIVPLPVGDRAGDLSTVLVKHHRLHGAGRARRVRDPPADGALGAGQTNGLAERAVGGQGQAVGDGP